MRDALSMSYSVVGLGAGWADTYVISPSTLAFHMMRNVENVMCGLNVSSNRLRFRVHRQTESREGPQLKYSISGAFSSALWPRQGYVLLKSSPWLGAREHRGQVLAARHDAHPRHGADTRDLARARVAVRGEVQRHGKQPRVRGTREQRARTVIDETQLGLSREQARCGQPA